MSQEDLQTLPPPVHPQPPSWMGFHRILYIFLNSVSPHPPTLAGYLSGGIVLFITVNMVRRNKERQEEVDLKALLIKAKDSDSFYLPQDCRREGPVQQVRAGSSLRGNQSCGSIFQRLKGFQDQENLNYTLGLQAPMSTPFPLPAYCSLQGPIAKSSPLLSPRQQAQKHGQFLREPRDRAWITSLLKATLLTAGPLAPV